MSFKIHGMANVIHLIVNRAELDIKFYLDRMASLNESGFHPGTMPIINMTTDARILRELADRIDAEKAKLIGDVHLIAAE